MGGIPRKEHQSIRSPFPMFFPRHLLKFTGSVEAGICFNSGKGKKKPVSHITNFTVKFPGSGEIAWVSLPGVLVMRLALENHVHDQNACLSDTSPRQLLGWLNPCPDPAQPFLGSPSPTVSLLIIRIYWLTISINLFQYLTLRAPLLWHPLGRYYLPWRYIGIAALSGVSLCSYLELTLKASFTLLKRHSNIWKRDPVSLSRW